tara:strand:+ start:57056 stop:58453 length:1398 start_codon:yes stop_codon:yes gene_type:complete
MDGTAGSGINLDNVISAENLGSSEYKKTYNVRYAYYTGSMYRGIASKELVIRMSQAGLMSFYGSAGLSLDQIEQDITAIQAALKPGSSYGVNLIHNMEDPNFEMQTVKLFIEKGICFVEAAAFMQVSSALVFFKLHGISKGDRNQNKIIAKISRPEVATSFMSPAPKKIIQELLEQNLINSEQAEWAKNNPICDDVTVEADSGGHTDQGISTVMLPTIIRLRDELMAKYQYKAKIRVGLAGGLGTPEAIAAAFIMGADYVSTGSINQCTPESGITDIVKDMLQDINIQDTDYAPAGDMFEIGARVQVLKKGVFFPARANRLFMLYNHYDSLEELPEKIKTQLQSQYFKKSFDDIFTETTEYFQKIGKYDLIEKAHRDSKHKMALVFRWYFGHSVRLAFEGDEAKRVNFQVHTGPALGAFNQWVKGTELENWRNRHVDTIAEKLMTTTAELINQKITNLQSSSNQG